MMRQRGFGVVELMVAIAISLLLMAGTITLFVGSRTSYETTQRLSRIQESGRFALDQIVADIREAGFQGCARANLSSSRAADFAISTLDQPTGLLWNFAVPVEGFQSNLDDTWTPALNPIHTALDPAPFAPAPESDVLVLRIPRRNEPSLRLAATQLNGAEPLTVPAVAGSTIAAQDEVMITDCEARAYFQVTSYAGGVMTHAASGHNTSADLLHPFRKGAEITPLATIIYYVAPGTDPTRPALWRRVGLAAPAEIAEGIERFEVWYGVDDAAADGRVDTYVSADDVTNWADVLSVRVALLARAPEPYGVDLDVRTYRLLERTAGPFNDRYQRQVFTSTIALRNQVID